MLGCTVGNTKSQLHKARLALRRYLLREARRHRLASDRRQPSPLRAAAPVSAGM
jgi:DNA-directed RNA polymerase specialized sigma24 family protein